MHHHAAFIGHQPHISLAELAASVPGFTLDGLVERSAVLFGSSEELGPKFLDNLGGTVVLARRLGDGAEMTLDQIPQLLQKQVASLKGKVTFSIRSSGLSTDTVRDLYRACKNHLKKHGRPSRYVGNERRPAASVLLRDAGLLGGKGGCEICVIKHDKVLWVGVTIAAHDIDAYTKRDIEKPVRDTTVGLLPPKLAQIMLNLGHWLVREECIHVGKSVPKILTVFDPFCGTGVIPLECLMRRWNVIASDKAEKAMLGTKKNIEWIRKEEDISKTAVLTAVWKQDATKPFSPPAQPDMIVTETSLGPALRSRPTSKDTQEMKSDSERLEEAFLRNAAATLTGAPVVCTWPVWYYSRGPVRLERVWDRLASIGYEAVLPPGIVSTERASLLYRRPEQFVGREIVLLRPLRKHVAPPPMPKAILTETATSAASTSATKTAKKVKMTAKIKTKPKKAKPRLLFPSKFKGKTKGAAKKSR